MTRVSPNHIKGPTGNDSCTEAFSSYHPGGLLFVSCDGKVKFTREDIEFNDGGSLFNFHDTGPDYNHPGAGIYQRLGARDDGQPLGNF